MDLQTRVARNQHGDLQAETALPLGRDRRELRITTRKNTVRKSLETRAIVVQVSEDGLTFSHAIGFGSGGDFSQRLAEAPGARTTEKALRNQHSSALALAQGTLAAACAHYGY